MGAMDTLRAIVDDPRPQRTARQIIEARLGRDLGPVATMPKDTRRALMLLGLQLVKGQRP